MIPIGRIQSKFTNVRLYATKAGTFAHSSFLLLLWLLKADRSNQHHNKQKVVGGEEPYVS